MEKMLEKVPESNSWTNIKKIKEGFDDCTKYCFIKDGQKFIIKIFPKKGLEKKKENFVFYKEYRTWILINQNR